MWETQNCCRKRKKISNFKDAVFEKLITIKFQRADINMENNDNLYIHMTYSVNQVYFLSCKSFRFSFKLLLHFRISEKIYRRKITPGQITANYSIFFMRLLHEKIKKKNQGKSLLCLHFSLSSIVSYPLPYFKNNNNNNNNVFVKSCNINDIDIKATFKRGIINEITVNKWADIIVSVLRRVCTSKTHKCW